MRLLCDQTNGLLLLLLKPIKPAPFLALLLIAFSFAQAQDTAYVLEDTLDASMDLFGVNEPAEITLTFDIKQFLKNKNKDTYLPAQLKYHFDDDTEIEKEIRVRARGNNRKEVCSFPPILLNIKNSFADNPYLKDTKKIKLVTHCTGRSADYLFKEYLAYQIYSILSEYSFRVRLVKVRYIDTGKKNKEQQTWAFIIEPEKMMAERLASVAIKMDRLNLQSTEAWTTDVMAFFQYMIGNADYSITSRHNVKLLKLKKDPTLKPIPVPYDFDYTGFVDAHYAIPGGNLGLKDITERYYLGACRTSTEYDKVLSFLKEKRGEIYAVVSEFEFLEEKTKKGITTYLDQFYAEIDYKNFIDQKIEATCR